VIQIAAIGLKAWAWVRENWKLVWGLVTALLLVLLLLLWRGNARLAGELKQCQEARATQQKELDASASMVTDLQAKVKARCAGSVDVVVKPPPVPASGWNSMMNPCPEVTLKANWDGSTENTAAAAVTSNAHARAVEKGGGTPCPAPESWALALGGGVSLGPATIWHGSMAADYHRLRAYGTLDQQGTWGVGAQVKVLTGNWP
jgi:hypothetical protein